MVSSIQLLLTSELVEAFAAATADRNSLHMDGEFARRSRFRKPIVHGMLPVAVLLLASMPEKTWLRSLSCRFLQPAMVGDLLDMTLAQQAADHDALRYAMTIRKGDTVVTSGLAEFAATETSFPPPTLQSSFFDRPPDENVLTAKDIAVGHTEQLRYRAAPAALRTVVDGDWTRFNTNVVAALPISTLIGMRLPGRFATFNECSIAFRNPIAPDATVQLEGVVDKISAAGSRVHLKLAFIVGDEEVGQGNAATIVNLPSPQGLDCDALRAHIAMGLAGRVVLVTGASRGIGEVTARLFAMHGAKVAVHYFRGAADANAIVDNIRAHGGTAFPVHANLADAATIQTMFATIRQELGEVDVLVNNAVGEFEPAPLTTLEAADYLAEFNISLFGMHACCKEALPHMHAQKWGKIINMGTVATDVPPSGQNRYITVKSAVVGYTRSLAAEVAPDNIQVNMVMPQMTETSLIAAIPTALVQKLAEENPTGRLLQPVDVAKVIVFLASDWANPISGQRIALNQGEVPFL
jgi:NAD(P)-dependent dehydrogenase (short-subunit alcohol dehydrogenase family)/acyl dehydratase